MVTKVPYLVPSIFLGVSLNNFISLIPIPGKKNTTGMINLKNIENSWVLMLAIFKDLSNVYFYYCRYICTLNSRDGHAFLVSRSQAPAFLAF